MPETPAILRAALLCLPLLAAACGGSGEGDPWLFMDGDLSRLPELSGAESVHFSSHDRTGGNDDGFSGLFSRIRIDENREHVLAEMDGPGCVKRLWMTWPGRPTNLRVYLDGESTPTVDIPIDEFFSGTRPPFVPPWTGGDQKFGGVEFSYIPIPFEKSVKITTAKGVRFYQIDIHRYPKGTKIATFELPPSDEYVERLERSKTLLEALPGEAVTDGPWTVEKGEKDEEIRLDLEIPPGGAVPLLESDDRGVVREIRLFVDGGRDALRETVLEAWWDGESARYESGEDPSVSSPVADLFGSGIGPVTVRTVAVISSGQTGILRFPMPYDRARIRLRNRGAEPVRARAALLVGPRKRSKREGRFHVRSRSSKSVAGEPVILLLTEGEGHFVGTHLSVRSADGTSRFLEGDEWIYVDADTLPRHIGTGTEDYFNGGWYFARAAADLPFHAVSFRSEDFAPFLSAIRHHLTDRISFRSRFAFLLEHGESRNAPGATYEPLAIWYQREPHRAEPDAVLPEHLLRRAPVFPAHLTSSLSGVGPADSLFALARPLPLGGARIPWASFYADAQLLTEGSPALDFRIPVSAEGRYRVRVAHGRGPGFRDLAVTFDGRVLFSSLDAGADTLVPVVLSPKTTIGIAEGDHDVEVRAAGPDRGGSGAAGSDVIGVVHGLLLEPTEAFAGRWLVLGPFEDYAGQRFDFRYPPEEEIGEQGVRWARSYRGMGDESIRWKPAVAGPNGFVDLREAIGPGTHRIAYAVTWVDSPRARRALFSLGSDDGAQVWLNGVRIWRNPVHRAWANDQDRFTGDLRMGRNEILVKVNQGIAGWGFSLRLSDAKGDLAYRDRPF
ncbi:MAG: glycoside hydrolase family 172 protein [Candidatus Eisenbacteria bacterium]